MTSSPPPMACWGGMVASELVEVVDLDARPDALDDGGWWAVLGTFEGSVTGYRFADVRSQPLPPASRDWAGTGPWSTSLDRASYMRAVDAIRRRIEAGDVYQVNLCRVLSAPLLGPPADPLALAHTLALGNPARYQGMLHTGTEWVVSASPELFLARRDDELTSAPIKGTAALGTPFAAKDIPENVMIADLVRNDLGRIARTGSVRVSGLLRREDLPGLSHLVTEVRCRLREGVSWGDIVTATFPPGSVSGAPKHTALQTISDLEPVPRGPYCGTIGYVDADRCVAELAVGIRTFYTTGGGSMLHFGTGAGITYQSDPALEWAETELKAERLIRLAQG